MKIVDTKQVLSSNMTITRKFTFDDGYELIDIVNEDGNEVSILYTPTKRIVVVDSKQFKKYDRFAFNWYNPSRCKY